jgi:hypothetical protein
MRPLSTLSGAQPDRRTAARIVRAAFALIAALVCAASPLRADPTSIQEFAGRRDQWENLVDSRFELEGRVETFGAMDLRMKNLDLPFVFQEQFERPRTLPYVTITGRLERDGRRLQFRVTSLEDGKSETEMIREKLRLADATDPALYDRLAKWAADRADFYTDESLKAESRRLYEQGIEAALLRLPQDDPDSHLALAQKITRLGLSESLRQRILHAASWAELRVESRNRNPSYAAVLDRIRARFPGAETPKPQTPADLAEAYAKKPLDAYKDADEAERPFLERLLYIEAALRMAQSEFKSDHSNGLAVARMVDQHVPERPDIAADYREKELASREARSRSFNRQQVMDLRNDLRRLEQPERAQRVVKDWIEARFSARRPGPLTDVDRAEHELEMAEDRERALELVSAAMRIDPQTPGAVELLARLGYAWHEGRAVLKEHVPPPPPDPIAVAMQQGRILAGMSAVQVRATLGGEPETIVRLASQEGVTELWHYPGQRITVSFQGTRRNPELKVSKIVELNRPQPVGKQPAKRK